MSGARLDAIGEPFAVDVDRGEDRVDVTVRGELDLVTTPRLEEALGEVPLDAHCTLDLRAVTFMDSTAVHAIMGLDVRARVDGWTLAIRRVPGSPVGRLLERCRVSERVELLD